MQVVSQLQKRTLSSTPTSRSGLVVLLVLFSTSLLLEKSVSGLQVDVWVSGVSSRCRGQVRVYTHSTCDDISHTCIYMQGQEHIWTIREFAERDDQKCVQGADEQASTVESQVPASIAMQTPKDSNIGYLQIGVQGRYRS